MCMGSTAMTCFQTKSGQNHPHVYGEYTVYAEDAGIELESPPCVWGVRPAFSHTAHEHRITPMCMGSTRYA